MNLQMFCFLLLIFTSLILCVLTKTNKDVVVDNINDMKDLKKLLRTKTNVLIMFTSGSRDNLANIKVFRDTAEVIKGVGTMVLIDCSHAEKKKICKKLKVSPSSVILKHYKDGDFNKEYDRQMTVTSMTNFMRDPTGELPWEEDPTGSDVFHIPDYATFQKYLKKDPRPTLVMFYVPWCGYCKRMKPDFSLAATELKPKYIMAAMDVERTENAMARKVYNISGFPTILYFESGKLKSTYEGENNKDGLIAFMQDPTAPAVLKTKEEDWSADTNSEIVHLTTMGFEPAIKDEASVLIMFYAPWCGHCKRMKPEYEKAALIMKEKKIPGILAALDATKENSIAQKYAVKGYPTLKYFVNGNFQFDVTVRDSEKIVNFMKDPKEPPPPPPPEKSWDEEESDVEHLTEETFKPFLKKRKHALVMFYAPWCGHCKKTKPEFSAAAAEFREDPRVAIAAVDCTKYATVCSTYGVRGYPTFKYFSYLKTNSDYNGGRTEADFVKFMKNPTDNSNEPSKEPEAFGNFPGSENILILDDDIETKGKEIKRLLVMFYAPWCGHCKTLKPEFAAAAIKATSNAYRLGAVDCNIQHKAVEKYKIKGFPTLLLFENGKLVDTYVGPRKASDILEYVSKQSKDEL